MNTNFGLSIIEELIIIYRNVGVIDIGAALWQIQDWQERAIW